MYVRVEYTSESTDTVVYICTYSNSLQHKQCTATPCITLQNKKLRTRLSLRVSVYIHTSGVRMGVKVCTFAPCGICRYIYVYTEYTLFICIHTYIEYTLYVCIRTVYTLSGFPLYTPYPVNKLLGFPM